APGVGRQIAAAVRGAELESREAVERALVDEMRERERGLERVPDGVVEAAVALQAVVEVARALRMHEDQHAELLGLGPERVELGVGELQALDAAADRGAAQAELLHDVLELPQLEDGIMP